MPSQRIKLRRGTTAQQQNFTGAEGEVTFDTDKNTLIVHDGTTKGGHVLPRDTDVKTDIDQLTDVYGILESYVSGFSGTTETYTITVAAASSGGGNVFYITGLENPHIVLTPGNRYIFDVSDSSNTGHPLYFTADDGTTNYTTGVSRIGTEGTAGAKVIFIIPADVPALKYYCSVHGLSMGNQISSVLNTPSSGGSSSLASFDISPALPTGETSWNLATDGDLSITEAGNWTFTATGDGTVDLSMKGAGGGYGKDTNALGGTGGETTGKISVTSGDTFIVTVGSKGVQSGGAGAYGGGGAGGNLTLPGSGGGYSGIFEGAEQQSKSILIAGGGGGGHGWDAGSATGNGGSGGGAEGTAGTAGSSGGGATQTGGGAGAGNGTGGTPLTGGTGGTRSTNQGSGGGGGGGYFGGGGGAAGSYNGNQNGTPGGGGSGYIGGTSNFAVTDGVTTAGAGSTTEVDGTFSMVGQVATTEETPTVATPTIISNSYGTVLHVTTDGAAGINADFADSSTTAATITSGGAPQLSTFSPYRHGGYSTHFDGTGDYLSTPSAEGFKFGTGDFTIEGWVNFNISNTTKWHTPIDCWQGTNNYNWLLNLKSDTFAVALGNNGAYSASHTHQVTISPALSAGNWYHFAVTRESGSLRHFINGIQQGSTISSGANISDNIPVAIGTNQDGGGNELDGYLSDIRVVKGTALYTADFTPPTERLTAVAGTELLTCHLPYIADGSSNSATITLNGDVHTEPFSPYDRVGYNEDLHGGAVYFDGTDDYLVVPANTGYEFGTGDFTVEAWINTDLSSFFSFWQNSPVTGSAGSDRYFMSVATDGSVYFYQHGPGSPGFQTSSGVVQQNTWAHIAIVRNSGTSYIYVNGVEQASSSVFSTTDFNLSTIHTIGYTVTPYYGRGYISDLRVVNGTAVYTADFTPPVTLLESTNAALHIKGVEGHIIDKAQSDHRLTLVGNTVASIAQSKYAGSSMYFDGSGDYLTAQMDNLIISEDEDWTVEFWAYTSNVSTDNSFITFGPTDSGTGAGKVGFGIYESGTRLAIIDFSQSSSNKSLFGNSSQLTANTWHHLAFVKSGSQVALFIDGTIDSSGWANIASNITISTRQRAHIGGVYNIVHNGYLEDVRITKGLARYTTTFTPPTESLDLYTETGGTTEETTGPTVTTYNLLSDSSKTELLITTDGEAGVNSSFADSSSNAATITASGTPQLNTFSPYRHGGYSTHFDGNGDELAISPSASELVFGTDAYTVEFWINPSSTPSGNAHVYGANSQSGFLVYYTSTKIAINEYNVSDKISYAETPELNTWTHYAFVREGTGTNQTKIYKNGTLVATGTDNKTWATNTSWTVGGNPNSAQDFNGYLSDLRVVKGTAVYTEDFTPPTERLTAIDGTQLLTCHLPYIADGSSNSATITLNGDVHTKPLSPYDHIGYIEGTHGGSVYFDGSGDYMSLPANDEYNFGSGDFTIEAWVYVDIAAIAIPIVGWDNGSYKIIRLTSSGINVESNSPSNISFTAGFTEQPVSNVWNHIAIVRSGNSFTAYLNGKGGTPYTYSGNVGNGTDQLNIGYKSDPTYYNGWMADLRITKGTAVYTTDFTPTTTPLESTNAALHIKGVEGHIIDKAQSGNNFTLVGNITASTAESKYAGSSIVLDGNGDHIQLENTPDIDVSTGDFTWEGWFNWNDISNNPKIFINLSSASTYWQLYVYNSKLTLRVNGSQTVYGVDTVNISTNQWYHIALVRSGDTFTVYKDGVAVITDTYAGSIGHYTDNGIGGLNSYPASSMNGYMEDVRLSKFARYTEDFTVPNAALEAPQVVQSEGSYTVATGGTITTDGNYKYHTFTEDGTFSITSVGTNTTIDVLAVGGGGAGGGSYDSNAGGGGAGGYLEGSITAEVQSYDIVIGQGGVGASQALGTNGGNTTISVLNATALGGGYGGGGARATHAGGGDGGSGGGGAGFPSDAAGGAALQGDSGGLTGYGNAGGSIGSYSSDGGGGAGQPGGTNANSAGGDGRQWLDGNYYAGGGSGGAGGLAGGLGGGGAGSNGSGNGANATANTGGGGGGAYANPGPTTGGNGGSGVVIFRYPYQGTVTETAPTSTSYRYMKVVLNSVSSGTQAQVTEISFTGENGATDFITGQTITNWYGTGSTATSQSPTIALVNNAQSPQNSEHTNLDTLPFTLEYDLGASYIHGTQLRYLQLGSSDSAYRYPTSVTVYGATQPDFSDEVALITNSVQAYASVNSNTLIDLGTSITGNTPTPEPNVLTPTVVQNNVNYSNPGVAYVNNLSNPDQKIIYSVPVATWNSWDKVEIVFDAQVHNQDNFPSLFDLTGGDTLNMRSYIRANRNGVYAGGVSGTYSSDSTGWVSNWADWNTFTITVDMSQSTNNSTISANDVVKLTGTAPQTWTGYNGTSDVYMSFFQMVDTSNDDNGIVAYIDNIYIKGYVNGVVVDQFYEDFS